MTQPIPISEITDVKGDAALGGAGDAILPQSHAADYILQAATARAAANKYIAEQHEANLNKVLDSVNKLDYSGAMANDIPGITNNMSGIFGDIANNYDAITDPASNIQKWGEINGKLNGLQRQIQTSKAHSAVYNENQKMLMLHPEWNTDENQQLMQNFANTPIDQRKEFLLKQPTNFDPTVYGAAAAATTKTITNKDQLSPGKTYIVNTKGETIDPDDYVNSYTNYLKSTMVNGRSGLDNLKAIYDKMPADENGDKPDFQDVIRQTALATLPKNTQSVTMKPNEAQIASQRLAESYYSDKNSYNLGLAKLAQDDKAIKANEIKPEEGAEAKYLALHNALSGNGLAYEFGQNIYGSDPKQDITVTTGGPTMVAQPDGSNKIEILPTVKQAVPEKQFISATPDGTGNLVNTYKINSLDASSGKLVSKTVTEKVPYGQAISDFNRIYGNKFAPAIAAGSSNFNKKKLNSTNPSFDDLDRYFKTAPPAGTTAPANQPSTAPAKKLKYNPASGQFE